MIQACRALTQSQIPGYDYTREIQLTEELSLGDTVLLVHGGELAGYALFHTAPLVEGRSREELRVLKLVVARTDDIGALADVLMIVARNASTRRVAIRVQGEYQNAYAKLVAAGARVRWSDLRMAASGHAEPRAVSGVVLSNWEI
jgi:hypothetical protein